MEKTQANRKQTKYNKIIARTGDEYYVLDYTFDDTMHGKPFRGAVGSVFRPITNAEKDERTDPNNDDVIESFREIWVESVKSGTTERSLESFVSDILNCDGLEAVFDLSYYDVGVEVAELHNKEQSEIEGHELEEPELCEFSECTGGGRCFHKDTKFDVVYDPELLKIAMSFEKD